jgi:effector-binding domain-containing protein
MLTKRIKRVKAKPFTFLFGEAETDIADIPASGKKIMDKLTPFMKKQGIAVEGACVWDYKVVAKGRVRLRAGFPVAQGTGIKGKSAFAVSDEPAWECYSTEYAGTMESIHQAWGEFMEKVGKKGLKPGKKNREIYHKWIGMDSPDNLTELQVQVK